MQRDSKNILERENKKKTYRAHLGIRYSIPEIDVVLASIYEMSIDVIDLSSPISYKIQCTHEIVK